LSAQNKQPWRCKALLPSSNHFLAFQAPKVPGVVEATTVLFLSLSVLEARLLLSFLTFCVSGKLSQILSGYLVADMALNGAVSNVDRTPVSVEVYEHLHGVLNPESSTLASILMMELKVVGKDICKVEFLMQFKVLREDQPDPTILDMMPSSSWDFKPPKQKLNDASMSDAYEITSAIAFSPRQRTKFRGPDTAFWTTNGNAVFSLVKPAVLISRRTDDPFLVECRVKVERDRSGSSSQDRRKPELRTMNFRLEPPSVPPSVAGALAPYPNNLEYIMQG
jgi:hypothetical protein